MNEVYEDKLTYLYQDLQRVKKIREHSEVTNKMHLEKIQRLEKIIIGCNTECDTTFDKLSAKANEIPEVIRKTVKPIVKIATEAE